MMRLTIAILIAATTSIQGVELTAELRDAFNEAPAMELPAAISQWVCQTESMAEATRAAEITRTWLTEAYPEQINLRHACLNNAIYTPCAEQEEMQAIRMRVAILGAAVETLPNFQANSGAVDFTYTSALSDSLLAVMFIHSRHAQLLADMRRPIPLSAPLPDGVQLPSGVSPEVIQDQQKRREYEANIAAHAQLVARHRVFDDIDTQYRQALGRLRAAFEFIPPSGRKHAVAPILAALALAQDAQIQPIRADLPWLPPPALRQETPMTSDNALRKDGQVQVRPGPK